MELDTLLDEAVAQNASDVHLVAGEPPVFRVAGNLVRRPDTLPLDSAAVDALLLPALSEASQISLETGATFGAETLINRNAFAFQVTVFRERGRLAGTIRVVLATIPSLSQITTGDALARLEALADLPRGLVLFTGPTGCGKMTTACAVVEHINQTRAKRIFAVEQTPSYAFASRQSVITALQVGGDVDSVEQALRTVLRANADVVYVSELPTVEAVRDALTLAETGHLVLAILHAESSGDALTRLVGAFPTDGQNALRGTLARSLAVVVNQRLLVRSENRGRVAAYEFLVATPAVRDALAAGRVDDLPGLMTSEPGMQTMADALRLLQETGAISEEARTA